MNKRIGAWLAAVALGLAGCYPVPSIHPFYNEREVGVDVMKFAVKGEAFGMWNSSCIGCGVCIHVCPTDVLTFGHHQLVTLATAPPLRRP